MKQLERQFEEDIHGVKAYSLARINAKEQVNRLEASVKSIHAGLEEKMDHMVHDVLKAIGDAHGPPSGSFRHRAVLQ
eukprot:jgi/Pico_ML_1/52203/g2940.t1